MVGTLRLFFALVPDAPMRDALGALARGVAARVHGKPVAATNAHLTLVFLGETPATALPALRAIAERAPRDAFTLLLDRIGGFRGSGVAWAGAGEVPAELARLQRSLTDSLACGGFPVEARPFRAHVTLARKCRGVVREPLSPALRWAADRFELLASTLAPGGSIYRTVAAWPLAPRTDQDAAGIV